MSRDEASTLVTGLFRSSYPALVGYALRMSGRLEIAQEVVQETFFLLYRELRGGRMVTSPNAWLLTVIRRKVNSQASPDIFQRGVRAPSEALDALPARPFADQEQAVRSSDLRKLFSVLTPREEEVILLRLAALKYREIGAHLGISEKTVSALVTRALRKLQQAAVRSPRVDSPSIHGKDHVSKTLH